MTNVPNPAADAKEEEFNKFMRNVGIARKAIIDDLNQRHKSGDAKVQMNSHRSKSYVSGGGAISCPVCKTGTLRYSRAGYNGHVNAQCTEGKNCVGWME